MSCGLSIEATVIFNSSRSAKKDWPKIADIAEASDIQIIHLVHHLVHDAYELLSPHMEVSANSVSSLGSKWSHLCEDIIAQHDVLIELVTTLDGDVSRVWYGRARRIRRFLRAQKARAVALYNDQIADLVGADDTAVVVVNEMVVIP